MLARPANFNNYVGDPHIKFAHLLAGGGLSITSHHSAITAGGVTYLPAGKIRTVSQITRSNDIRIGTFTIEFAGATPDMITLINTSDPQGEVMTYRIIIGYDTTSPALVELYSGIIDAWEKTENENSASLRFSLTNPLGRWRATNGRFFSPSSQRGEYSDDNIFTYATPNRPPAENWGGRR